MWAPLARTRVLPGVSERVPAVPTATTATDCYNSHRELRHRRVWQQREGPSRCDQGAGQAFPKQGGALPRPSRPGAPGCSVCPHVPGTTCRHCP